MSHSKHSLPEAPKPIQFSKKAQGAAALAALLGIGAFVGALFTGHAVEAWSAYLIGAFFALSLGLFGGLWTAILHVSKGHWSISTRRISEAMTTWMLPGGALALLIALGSHSLYHWTDIEALKVDALLQHKKPFLNMGMFLALTAASMLIWIGLSFVMNRNSRQQDETGKVNLIRKNRALSAIFIVLYALSFSVVSFYLLMSLDPHWFSTMYAVLTFTDMIQTGTAFVALIAASFVIQGQLKGFIDENHLHSVAKMMFAATGFWAYIYFCQFLLIWYVNIPEETIYFINRTENGWLPYFMVLPLFKFLIPFIYMAPRANKRKPWRVLSMAVLLLLAQFWELFILVSPSVGHGEHGSHGHLPLIEAAVTLGFFGLFFLVFAWSFSRHAPIPLKDPNIRECLNYHQ